MMTVNDILDKIETINMIKEIINPSVRGYNEVVLNDELCDRLFELIDVYEFELRNTEVKRLGWK